MHGKCVIKHIFNAQVFLCSFGITKIFKTMNRIYLFVLMGVLLTNATVYAQVVRNYKNLAQEKSADYHEIVRQARKEFAKFDFSKIENKKAKKQFERWAYYWANRINPDGTFPNENTGYFNAGILDSNGKIVTPKAQNLTATYVNNQTWTNIGPRQSDLNNNGYPNYPQMGRLNAFLRIKHPTDTNKDVLFVGAPNGGVWKSTDGGTNWAPKLDLVAGIGVTDIKTVPGTTTANYTTMPIYVSTGDYDGRDVRSIGVLKSIDGGETFSSTGLSYNLSQQKTTGDLVVIDANTVFVGGNDDVLKTIDGGTNWSTAFNTGYLDLMVGRAVRNNKEIMYSDAFGGIMYTSDYTNDSNWSHVVTPVSYNKAAVTIDDNGNFFIQDIDGQIKKFDKVLESFSNVGNVPTEYNSQYGYNQALIVTDDLIISGEFNGTHSVDNGANWYKSLNGYWYGPADVGTYIHSDHHRMGKLDANTDFWSVNDGGLNFISYTSFAANTKPIITYKSSNVVVTQSYSVAINPKVNDGAIIMANQDNDAYSKHNGTWYAVAAGDGIQSAIDYNDPKIRYVGDQNGTIYQTSTGFNGELFGNGNYVAVPGVSFYFPLEIHKTNPKILFAGGNEVYKLDASSGLTIASVNSGLVGTVGTISTHGNNIMAATNSAIKFSSNQGTSWSTISMTAISGDITSVDFDATNSDIMYVTVSGYSSGQKVFKTTDGGSNWINISGNLPNIVVNEIMLKQGQTDEFLFVATELGVYYTANGGSSWTKLGSGLPNVDVRDIEIHYTADKLIAGTFGRGAWEIPIANNTLSNADVQKTTLDIRVYPNPADQKMYIDTPSGEYEYLIYNAVGGIVKHGAVSRNDPIDVSKLAPSVYIVRVFNDDSSLSQKIIVD